MKNVKQSFNQIIYLVIGTMFGYSIASLINSGFNKPSFMIMVGVASAMISLFIDFLIQPEQIFGFWGRGLEWFKSLKHNPFKFIAKPLGSCIFCMNVWVTLAVFLLTKPITGIGWLWFILVASISHIALAVGERNING
jgi:hypothetical protein